ncbi:MAG: Translation elongation factor 1 beta [Chrysothrix sp. TS-e1954]|nr:MAG: Translation elongation factor 1 beta [Chrysothrix sp. TS-e1954]
MGFTDLANEAGLTNGDDQRAKYLRTSDTFLDSRTVYEQNYAIVANRSTWIDSRSSYTPSQADVKTFQALKSPPKVEKHPHAFRWYKHIDSFSSEFKSLPGDPSKPYTAYGPEASEMTINPKDAAEDDDEVDLFGSDDEEEDAEAARVREERLKQYAEKKAGKVKPAAKSIVTMEVKPWDDETDMKELEKGVRSIEKDGLTWGASKLVAVGYGVSKLQINLVVEDDKISLDELQEEIEGDEDHVQSTDIAAMQKL